MRTVLALGAAGAALLGPIPVAAAAPTDDEPSDGGSSHCVLDLARGAVTGCFDSFLEAQAHVARARTVGETSTSAAPEGPSRPLALTTLAWHFEHHHGGGASLTITGTSCTATWYPSQTWATTLSSTRISPSCSAAKHYTGSSCSGSYQIANAAYPALTNLGVPLNDNTRCVKYG